MNSYHRCYAEVSLKAIGHNIEEVRKRIQPGVRLMVVIKADAYGHGALVVGRYLEQKADYFGVATLEEAIELREGGITLPILVLGYTSPSQYADLVEYEVAQTIYSLETAEKLDAEAGKRNKKAAVHIALDTGMTRIGFQSEESDADQIAGMKRLPNINLEGIYTHFACADQKDKTYCSLQMEKYDKMIRMLKDRNVTFPIEHVCNSAGIMEFEDYKFDMVRCGIVTYGLYPSEEVVKENMDLRPALQWKAHVIHVKDVKPGLGVSYGATYITHKPVTRIATVSVGYADGYPRALSSKGRVLIHGRYAPILGRVCMDQLMVEVSDIPDVQVEDIVTLVGTDGDKTISIEEVADPSARFNYEMVCGISKRVPRIYPDEI